MALTPRELLQKATFSSTASTGDIGNGTKSPLALEQADQFISIAIAPQALLSDIRVVRNSAPKWNESKLEFWSRILRPGTQATRLVDGSRVVPTTSVVEMSTTLIRGEVPVSDEVWEDNVEGDGFRQRISNGIAERAGLDIEELFIKGDTASGDSYLAQQMGFLKLAAGTGTNTIAAAGNARDWQKTFRQMVLALPDQFKRDKPNMRFYMPTRLYEMYADALASRNTALGDFFLESNREIRYQDILLKPVPQWPITTASSVDSTQILLCNRMNLIAGFQRQIRVETFRDPREGVTSYVLTARVACAIEHVPATVLATGVIVTAA
jgi:hypothetical protein